MKGIGYCLFAVIFNICRVFPCREKKVLLFNGHNQGLNGNLLEIKRALMRSDRKYSFVYMAKRDLVQTGIFGKIRKIVSFFVVLPYHMATAEFVFLNDNFLPLAYCMPSKKAKIVQLWHGTGAFKRFGLSSEQNQQVIRQVTKANTRLTHLFVTAKGVIPFYQEAFGVPLDKIYATGLPITDVYYEESEQVRGCQRFYQNYPALRQKKLFLYTPTFRNTKEENDHIIPMLGIEKMHEALGEDWVIGIKMHPKYPVDNIPNKEYVVDLTKYPYMTDLYFVSDMLMTDYSSTVVEYCLLDKPILFYAYDLEQYDRGFYFDYQSKIPGILVRTSEELYKALSEKRDVGKERRHGFVKMQHDYQDNASADRIIQILTGEKIYGNED